MPPIAASSEYSRRRPRRSSIPRMKGSTPRGFAPRPQVGTGIQKKDQSDVEEKEESENTSSSNYSLSSSGLSEGKVAGEEQITELDSGSGISTSAVNRRVDILEEVEEESYGEDVEDQKTFTGMPSVAADNYETDGQRPEEKGDRVGLSKQHLAAIYSEKEIKEREVTDVTDEVGKEKDYMEDQLDMIATPGKQPTAALSEKKDEEVVVESDVEISDDEELGKIDEHVVITESDMEELLMKQKADIDAQAHKQMLEHLAEGNFSSGNKVFVFPEVVKSDEVIEIFFNRSLSALMNEPDVLIKGAFNDWRWNFFTERMHKTDLQGDWWSCQLSVPKEAYKIDFVFFNGGNVYENNDSRDFSLLVEGGMDELAFEDILLEEKRRELEKLAAEEAERKRQAEEQLQREAERAANEADRAQAKVEVGKKREALHRVMKLAKPVDDVWHIEPSVFKGGDMVRLYYNRSSRPLAHATEIWIHGGYNNWIHGLSIVERLFRSEKKDGDWWCAEEYCDGLGPSLSRELGFSHGGGEWTLNRVVAPYRALVLD